MSRRPARADRPDRDEGAVIVIVALMMTVLLGVGALVVDFGALYVEKRMLQNGADAAAMALVQECGIGHCTTAAIATSLAQQYATNNASGRTVTTSVCGGGPSLPKTIPACTGYTPPAEALRGAAWIRVVATGDVAFQLIPGSKSVTASSVAAWGGLNDATTLPLVLSQCDWEAAGGDLTTGVFPAGVSVTFQSTGTDDGCTLKSGKKKGSSIANDFGWLTTPATTCLFNVTVGGTYMGDKSNDIKKDFPKFGAPPPPPPKPGPHPKPPKPPPACQEASLRDQTVTVPIFDSAGHFGPTPHGNASCPLKTDGPGAGKDHLDECFTYTIAGFAEFHITAYDLTRTKADKNSTL
ncbi:MAG: pilus assembly protein TadG-related protein, partial [Actinomycetota bacterium]